MGLEDKPFRTWDGNFQGRTVKLPGGKFFCFLEGPGGPECHVFFLLLQGAVSRYRVIIPACFRMIVERLVDGFGNRIQQSISIDWGKHTTPCDSGKLFLALILKKEPL